jgi:hypothetical protein
MARLSIRPFWRWYDLWIGLYFDREAQALYICPVPMFGVRLSWRQPHA